MTRILVCLTFLITVVSSVLSAQQAPQVSDKIVAVVNDHIVLKSEVDGRVFEFMQSSPSLQFNEELWFDVLESLIDNFVLVEKAKIDSIVVTDEEVNRELDNRIRVLSERAGGADQLERAIGKTIVQLRAEFREQFRQDITSERLRQQKRGSIQITRPEVLEFFNAIPTDSLPMIPEMVELAHIVSIPPPKQEATNRALSLATAIRDSLLNHGANFELMARTYGEDGTASQGGLLPLMPLSDLVPEYSAAAAALEPGQLSQVVRTPFGFHVIRLNRRVADQIETNHILIRVRDDELDEEFSINFLASVRDSVLHNGVSFSQMARRHSDDKTTAPSGGRLLNTQNGDRRIPVEVLDQNLYRVALLLENPSDISEPRSFNTQQPTQQRAFRVVQLINRIPEHRANLEQDYELIRNFALQQKQMRIMQQWVKDLRNEVYVEYKIYHPYLSAN